jgi:hypothetical protein
VCSDMQMLVIYGMVGTVFMEVKGGLP